MPLSPGWKRWGCKLRPARLPALDGNGGARAAGYRSGSNSPKLINPYRIDIGGGLGDLQGKLWRIGVLGHSAQPTFLLSLMSLLETPSFERRGYPVQEPGKAGETPACPPRSIRKTGA